MPSLFTKLWNLLHQQDKSGRPTERRRCRLEVEAFEERLAMSTLPVNTGGVISGTVFLDANKNGLLDSGEKAVTGLTITLSGKTTANADVTATTKTDANGAFTFFQVAPGTYSLTRALGNQLVSTTVNGSQGGTHNATKISNIFMDDGQVSDNNLFAVRSVAANAVSLRQFLSTNVSIGNPIFQTPGSGVEANDGTDQPNTKQDFGTVTASTLGGVVFNDLNNNGTKDDVEAGIAAVKLVLTGIEDSGKAVYLTKTTDADGAYTFNIARPGRYTVQVLNQPAGFRAGTAIVGSLGGLTALNTQVFGIDVAAGSTATGYNFAELAVAAVVADSTKPVIGATLVDDTIGNNGTNSDSLTTDATVQGVVVSSFNVTRLQARFDSKTTFVDVSSALSGGKFLLNLAQLNLINGGTLSQGAHTLHLRATDAKGRTSAIFDLVFTLDNTAPTTPTLALDSASDTGSSSSDGRTDVASVTIKGKTTAASFVEVFQGTSTTPLTATADGSGNYTFADVTLTPGVNDFVVRVRDSAGNISQFKTFFVLNQGPTLNAANPIADINVNKNGAATVLDLAANFLDADTSNSIVRLNTNFGPIDIELLDGAAPQSVANFLNYVTSGRYDSSIFHRLAFNAGNSPFVLQGGGFKVTSTATTSSFTAISTDPAVKNEFSATRSNVAGTIAMAKLGSDPNSATDQFFFNLNNNASNLDNQNGGFTVFARVLTGSDQRTVNTMATTPVQNQSKTNSAFTDLPVQNYSSSKFPVGTKKDNFLVINSTTILRQTEALTYSVVNNTNSGLILTAIANNRITVNYTANMTGEGDITIRATDKFGAFVDKVVHVKVSDPNLNTAPVAETTTLTTAVNTTVSVDLRTLASDAETSDDNLIFTVDSATNGTIVLDADGHTAKFTPVTDYAGPATFVYSVKDTGKGTGAALTTGPVTINVTVG